jgi:dUTP pyrophosphatase
MTSSGEPEPLVVQVKLLRPGARLPYRASQAATGWDLHACLEGEMTIGQLPAMVPTGLAMAVPPGWDAQVRPRSGLARQGVIATFGTLDPDYRGEVMVTLYTTAAEIEHTIRDGDRIAQLVFTRSGTPELQVVNELEETARGAGGHGSTGA